MKKIKMGMMIIISFIITIIVLPTGICREKIDVDQIRSNEDPKIIFYSHFADDYQVNADNYLNLHPEEDQKVTLKQAAVHMENTVKFILTPQLSGEIFIADTAPTGGETGKFLHSIIYMSASRVTERVLQTVSIGTESDPDKYGSDSGYGAIGVNPSQNQKTLETTHSSITADGNLLVTIKTEYTGVTPTSFHMHTGPSWPTGISLRYTNQLAIDVSASVDIESKSVTVTATHNNPLGDDNIKYNATSITWDGNTQPKSIIHEDKSLVWTWDYNVDNAKIGDYTVTITVEDLQKNSASNSAVFNIPSDKKEDKKDEDKSPIPGFEALNRTI